MVRVLCLLLAIVSVSRARDLTCATCHAKEAASQPGTPMAHALPPSESNPVFQSHGALHGMLGKFIYQVKTADNMTTYSVSDGKRSVSYPVHWIFGARSQTFVLEREGRFVESLVSYFPATGSLDLTVGDQGVDPKTLDEAVGRTLETNVITACFKCHSTRSVKNGELDLKSLLPGVTCERCHTDAPTHLASFSSKPVIPERLGKKSTESILNFCGQCHRSWETVVRNNWRGENNVRFQPYRLTNSRCFNGTDPRISCLSCHNPHENLVHDDISYDAKCLVCHAAHVKQCPVAKERCVSCHMPKIELPGAHRSFTDHQIRIVRAGEAYPN